MSNTNIETGKSAFPVYDHHGDGQPFLADVGMGLRQYAAIKLQVPNSGTDWLDEMVRQSLRDEIATKAMQGLIVDPDRADQSREECARLSYLLADAMLRAREAA